LFYNFILQAFSPLNTRKGKDPDPKHADPEDQAPDPQHCWWVGRGGELPRRPERLEMRVARPASTSLLFFFNMRLTSPSCTKNHDKKKENIWNLKSENYRHNKEEHEEIPCFKELDVLQRLLFKTPSLRSKIF
jgi:hypothetical protein